MARPGAEEQIDNESTSTGPQLGGLRARRFARQGARSPRTRLGSTRSGAGTRPCCVRNITFHRADDSRVLVFSKRRQVVQPDGSTWDDVILVVANTDPHSTATTMIHLDMPALGYKVPRRRSSPTTRSPARNGRGNLPRQHRHARPEQRAGAHHPRPPLLLIHLRAVEAWVLG